MLTHSHGLLAPHRRTLATLALVPTHVGLGIYIGLVCKQDLHHFEMPVKACFSKRRPTVLHSSAVHAQTMTERDTHATRGWAWTVKYVLGERASASVSVDDSVSVGCEYECEWTYK